MIEKNKVKSGLISTLVKIDNRVNLLQEHICSFARLRAKENINLK